MEMIYWINVNGNTLSIYQKSYVYSREQAQFTERIRKDDDYDTFRYLHDSVNTPAFVWKTARLSRDYETCRTIANLWVTVPDKQPSVYPQCESIYSDQIAHILATCTLRDILLQETGQFHEHSLLSYFVNSSDENTVKQLLLGRQIPLTIDTYGSEITYNSLFTSKLYKYVKHALLEYNRGAITWNALQTFLYYINANYDESIT